MLEMLQGKPISTLESMLLYFANILQTYIPTYPKHIPYCNHIMIIPTIITINLNLHFGSDLTQRKEQIATEKKKKKEYKKDEYTMHKYRSLKVVVVL